MSKYIASLSHGAEYLQFRPSPPDKMILRIIEYMGEKVGRKLAVDVGCGSGQSTALLSKHFEKVLAVDSDQIQIKIAREALREYFNISLSVARADKLPCKNSSVSLVSAVQSAHWFDIPRFYEEVNRVLIPNGVLALSGYRLPKVKAINGTDLSQEIINLFIGPFGSYIPEGSKMVYLDNYRSGPFTSVPFSSENFIREDFETEPKNAKLDDLIGYMQTWSTYQNYLKEKGKQEAEAVLKDFSQRFPRDISIIFSYFLILIRKN